MGLLKTLGRMAERPAAATVDVRVGNMNEATEWKQRRELADAILSLLYARFRWIQRDPMACAAADQHIAKAIETKNSAALTVEATMGAMLDALHARNEDTMERWRKYMDALPGRIVVGS